MYEGVRSSEDGRPITFNILPSNWCIPSETSPGEGSPATTLLQPSPEQAAVSSPASISLPSSSSASTSSLSASSPSLWPPEWHGMPLGKYIDEFRCGDIDAKFHPRRRPLLDRLGMNWGDPMRYLHFTWMKLLKGMRWWMMFRGQPLEQLYPWTVIPDWALVADICKPEEVQGLKLGYVVHMAHRQEGVLYHHYRSRFEIYKRLNLSVLPGDRLLLDYPYKVEKSELPLQGELGYMIPHVPVTRMEDV